MDQLLVSIEINDIILFLLYSCTIQMTQLQMQEEYAMNDSAIALTMNSILTIIDHKINDN